MRVAYCTRSTLHEAYAAVVGLPAPVSAREFGTLRTRFEREWPVHEYSALQTMTPPNPPPMMDSDRNIPPFWMGQMSWEGGRWIGRWGHRTTALHRVVVEGERYHTFSQTMRPTLERWLKAARDAYAFAGEDPAISTVVFGYVNALDLDAESTDLSEWFRFNFAIEAGPPGAGLGEIAIGARIPRPELHARTQISLSAVYVDGRIRATVHTAAERDLREGSRYGGVEQLIQSLGEAKALAKETFFSFTTQHTLSYMGATDAEPQT